MSAALKRSSSRRAGAAFALAAFALVGGYWLAAAAAGSDLPSVEGMLVRMVLAAGAGYALGWFAWAHLCAIVGEVPAAEAASADGDTPRRAISKLPVDVDRGAAGSGGHG
jgi:hypothetical protein